MVNSDPSHEAKAYVSLLWQHIYARVRAMIHPHHKEHEPGGNDALRLPLSGLSDCYMTGVANGQGPTYDSTTGHYIPGGGGGAGQAFFEMFGLQVATVPGPTNLTGDALTITRVLITSDGECAGTAAGQSFTFAAGGGSDDNKRLSTNWGDGSALSASVTSFDSGTYLTVDVYFS